MIAVLDASPVPLSFALTAAVVLFNTPAAAPTTFEKVKLQVSPPLMVPSAKLMNVAVEPV